MAKPFSILREALEAQLAKPHWTSPWILKHECDTFKGGPKACGYARQYLTPDGRRGVKYFWLRAENCVH